MPPRHAGPARRLRALSGRPKPARTAARTGPVPRIERMAWRSFPARPPVRLDEAWLASLSDNEQHYGLPRTPEAVMRERLAGAHANSFAEMGRQVLDDLGGRVGEAQVLVLAHETHDLDVWTTPAAYLSHLYPGKPEAFAICEQGHGAPFTAVRLVDGLLRTGQVASGVVFVIEQAVSPFRESPAVDGDDVALMMVLGSGAGARLVGMDQFPAPSPPGGLATAVVQLRRWARDLAGTAPGEQLAVVLGDGLREHAEVLRAASDDVRVAAPGTFACGLWIGLHRILGDQSGRAVLLAEYEPRGGTVFAAVVEVDPAPGEVL